MNKTLSRVPEITIYFWIIKILATTVGETGADYLSATLNLGLALTSYIMSGVLLIALLNQFRLKKYIPLNYWFVVVLTSIVGTLITDRLVDEFGVSLVTTAIIFSFALLIIFVLWYVREKTLSMHSINTAKREIFYWAAVLLTFALGTSTGDLLGETSGLGYGISALVFGFSIAIITLAYYYLRLNSVLALDCLYFNSSSRSIDRRFTFTAD